MPRLPHVIGAIELPNTLGVVDVGQVIAGASSRDLDIGSGAHATSRAGELKRHVTLCIDYGADQSGPTHLAADRKPGLMGPIAVLVDGADAADRVGDRHHRWRGGVLQRL